MQQLPL